MNNAQMLGRSNIPMGLPAQTNGLTNGMNQACETRQPLVSRCLDELESELRALDDRIGILQNRLGPVLRPEPVSPTPCEKDQQHTVPTAERIASVSRHVRRMSNGIVSTLECLEI